MDEDEAVEQQNKLIKRQIKAITGTLRHLAIIAKTQEDQIVNITKIIKKLNEDRRSKT